MRNYLLVAITLISINSTAQTITWSAPVSVAPSSNGNMHPRIALDGSKDPVVVWGSAAMGGRAMFSRWNGTAFATPVALNPMTLPVFTASWAGPDLAAHGDTLYAVMKNEPEDTAKMYIVRSFDGGQNWSAPMQIGTGMDTSRFPTVVTDASGNPMVGYMQFDSNFSAARYVVTKSANFGTSFSSPVMAGNIDGEACDCCPGSLIRSGNTMIMLYRNNLSNIRTIWARISTDGGNTFSDSLEVDNTNWMVMSCPSSGPDGVIIGDTLYTVFRSSATGTRFYLSKASVSNQQLIYSTQYAADFTGLSQQDYPRIANAGNTVAMVWRQVVNGSARLCFSFTNNVANGINASYDTLATTGVTNADVAITPGAIHVVWEDAPSGTVKYLKGTYTTVGVKEVVTAGTPIEIYPNPAKDYFIVAVKDIANIESCVLYDNAGKQIILTPVFKNNAYSFSVSGIARGMYLVRMSDKSGKQFSSKLVIE